MNGSNLVRMIAILLIITAIAIQVQQFITWGHWWDWDQIHHESFSIALVFAGLVLLATNYKFRVTRRTA